MGRLAAGGYTRRMLTALFAIFAALTLPGLVILLVSARRAPVGFEDDRGFHTVGDAGTGDVALGAAARAG